MSELDKSMIENEIHELETNTSDESKEKLYIAQKKIEALNSTFY